MSADVINLADRRQLNDPGNGAREAVKDYLDRVHAGRVMARVVCMGDDIEPAMSDEDYFLAWLWNEGFQVVPVDD